MKEKDKKLEDKWESFIESVVIDENEGKIFWSNKAKRNKGREVTNKSKRGYKRIKFKGLNYYQHRVLFRYYNGRWPQKGMVVDHIDGDITNNKKENLREVKEEENSFNQAINNHNTSGIMGVKRIEYKTKTKWCAHLRHNGVKYARYFDTKEEAIEERKRLEEFFFREAIPEERKVNINKNLEYDRKLWRKQRNE